jgi:tetratricopeptide (TPR) repeat protein
LSPDGTLELDEINRYQEILARESSSLVFAALSEAYRKRNMLDQAVSVCRKGLHHHPEFVSGRVALARAYVDKGETDRAAKELERVILTAPDNLIAQELLLSIYEEKHDWDNLEKTVHRILSMDPRDEKAGKSWQTLRSRPTASENAPATGSGEIVTQTLAEIYASQGYYDKAFDIYRKLSVREPENPNLHERLADLKQQSLHRSARK